MNNLTVPVAHILRRLFNVVSVLAISQHYIGCPVKPNFSFRRDSAVAEGASQYNDISVSSLQTSIGAETQPGLSFRETLQKHSILLGQNTSTSEPCLRGTSDLTGCCRGFALWTSITTYVGSPIRFGGILSTKDHTELLRRPHPT